MAGVRVSCWEEVVSLVLGDGAVHAVRLLRDGECPELRLLTRQVGASVGHSQLVFVASTHDQAACLIGPGLCI